MQRAALTCAPSERYYLDHVRQGSQDSTIRRYAKGLLERSDVWVRNLKLVAGKPEADVYFKYAGSGVRLRGMAHLGLYTGSTESVQALFGSHVYKNRLFTIEFGVMELRKMAIEKTLLVAAGYIDAPMPDPQCFAIDDLATRRHMVDDLVSYWE